MTKNKVDRVQDLARQYSGKSARRATLEKDGRFVDRMASSLFLLLYAAMFYIVYRDYVSVEWGYTGLRFSPLDVYELFVIAFVIALQGWVMPQVINSPSSVLLWMLTALIFVPIMIITIMIGERPPNLYYNDLISLTIIMVFASYICRNTGISKNDPMIPFGAISIFIAVFSACTLILLYQYGEIMSFSNVEDVYFQRFAASDLEASSIVSYIRTHYIYVFSSVLFVSPLVDRRYWYLMPVGFFGFVVTYMIDASKIAFVIPALILGFFAVIKYANAKIWALNAGMAFLTVVSGILATYSSGVKLLADLILVRSIAIPAQTFAQYADVFSAKGYTWWSNVRGVSSFVPPPQGFASDPFWPSLGLIVGAEYYGIESRANQNANLFSGEGIAAAGYFGVIAIGLAMIIWLRIFDSVAKGWNQRFVVFITVPLGMSFTNTHLSTFLLSFGGLFWLLIMYFYKPKRTGTRTR